MNQILLLMLPDILFLGYLLLVFHDRLQSDADVYWPAAPAAALFVAVKIIVIILVEKRFWFNRLDYIKKIIGEFKRGRYVVSKNRPGGADDLARVCNDLAVIGVHFEDIVVSQRGEIERLREMYNNVVLSMSSYFLVLNDKLEVVFANESFCNKFLYELSSIYGKSIDSLFLFLTSRIKDAIGSLGAVGDSVVLEKTHLLSRNRISVIVDVKITRMVAQGKQQITMVMDDITGKLKKDYQISLISRISESIQKDEEIDQVLYAILTGATAGSGLGFNRAMLFLVDEKEQALAGRMAVGPDTMEEAIEIWSSLSGGSVDLMKHANPQGGGAREGRVLYQKVTGARFPLDAENVFTRSMNIAESVHIADAYNDPQVGPGIADLMDVQEFVAVPLVAANRSIGVIAADNKFNRVPISRDSVELLTIFAYQAALSIESYNNLSLLKREMQKLSDRQEAIVESEKMAAVGRIATHIAHEIRNPLVTMGGYARRIMQLMRDTGRNEEMIRKATEVILNESERLEKVLANVMDFTRPSPHIQEFNNINQVIHDTYDLLRNVFQEKKIKVEMRLEEEIPLVKSDFNQLKQVMLNLLQNSIDATPAGGRVVIGTSSGDEKIEIYVRDSGRGITIDDVERVFEPFYTTKVTGVGLGLAIVKKIVSDHGGDITARNLAEGGTEFTLRLNLPG